MRHLADRSGEALREVEEGYHDVDGEGHAAKAEVGNTEGEEGAARKGHQHVGEVAEVHEDGPEGVAIDVGALRGLEELLVHRIEARLHLAFVGEDFDDLLAIHALFGKALCAGKFDLLVEEEAGGSAAHDAHEPAHEEDYEEYDYREG